MPKSLTPAAHLIFPNGASSSAKKLDSGRLLWPTAPHGWPQPADALRYLNPCDFLVGDTKCCREPKMPCAAGWAGAGGGRLTPGQQLLPAWALLVFPGPRRCKLTPHRRVQRGFQRNLKLGRRDYAAEVAWETVKYALPQSPKKELDLLPGEQGHPWSQ